MYSEPANHTAITGHQAQFPIPSSPPWTFSEGASAFFWCIVLTFTSLTIVSSSNRINRFTSITLVLITGWGAFRNGEQIFPDAVFVDYYLRFVIILVSHIIWLVYSGTLDESARRDGKDGEGWMRGYKRLFNSRGIGEIWELPHLWPPKKTRARDKKERNERGGGNGLNTRIELSKTSAVLSHIGHVILNFTILCTYYEFLAPSSFPLTSYPLLHRPLLALSNFLPDYLILSTYHSLFATIFISLPFDSPSEWPPLFGAISAAYTVRGFWGKFWHRLIYRSFIGHSRVILRVLGISDKGAVGRLVSNVIVFVLSGLMHGAVPWMLGTRCAWRAGMEYWMMQPVAFMLEGIVGAYWSNVRKTKLHWARVDVLDVVERSVGYVWVISWLIWEAPRREGAVLKCYGL